MRSFSFLTTLSAAFAVIGCAGHGQPPPTHAEPGPVTFPTDAIKSSPALKSGVDGAALDPAVSPCDDFYQYACGGWLRATAIPADESDWYRSFSVINEKNELLLKQILEGYAKGESAGEPYAKALGDFYGSCMDEAAVEKAGATPLEPWLGAIAAVKDVAGLTRLLGRMQAELGDGVLFELGAAQDFGDASQVVGMLWQAGLGMPEREYYTDTTAKMTELRGKYAAHVARMLELMGDSNKQAKASAQKILAIETGLAKAWMTKEDRREPKKLDHRASREELPKLATGVAWDAWLDGAKASGVTRFNVAQPGYLSALGAMLGGKVALADWKTYLRFHLARLTADTLAQKWVDENFKWERDLTGAEKLPERWKRCVRAVDAGMGEALAQPFVKKTLGSEGKAVTVAMVQSIEKAMHQRIEKLAWMDDATRQAAFGKLAKIANKIAFPDRWRNYDALHIARESYLSNVSSAQAFEFQRRLAKIGKPVDRAEWQMSPPTVNAYYDAQLNEMVFPAGILQPPFYSNDVPRAKNFGGVGMVMGHELTHGFDDEGRQFDAAGNLKDWWSKSVNGEFERRAECVKKQYDGYVVLDDLHVNGKLTLGENIADLGGLALSYQAMAAEPPPPRGERSREQEFFLGFAQGWCANTRDESLRKLVATNPHSPPNLRVNGPLANLPEFAKAFDCKPGAKMIAAERCEIW